MSKNILITGKPGCGTCAKHCQFDAIEMKKELAAVNPARCMGCGVCESICPQHAIRLERDLNRSAPLDLDKLLQAQACNQRHQAS